jgi:hypothetical protein
MADVPPHLKRWLQEHEDEVLYEPDRDAPRSFDDLPPEALAPDLRLLLVGMIWGTLIRLRAMPTEGAYG